jgi:hypothetical protein
LKEKRKNERTKTCIKNSRKERIERESDKEEKEKRRKG